MNPSAQQFDSVLQYGALGILAVIVFGGLYLAWLVTRGFLDGIKAQVDALKAISSSVANVSTEIQAHVDAAELRIVSAIQMATSRH